MLLQQHNINLESKLIDKYRDYIDDIYEEV